MKHQPHSCPTARLLQASPDDSTWLLTAGAALLALANATKYASILFDPTVVALGGEAKRAVGRGGLIAATAVAMDGGLLALGGSSYYTGLLSTTLSRAAGRNPAIVILTGAAQWIGIACGLPEGGAGLRLTGPDGRITIHQAVRAEGPCYWFGSAGLRLRAWCRGLA
jgi:hypothetical protein